MFTVPRGTLVEIACAWKWNKQNMNIDAMSRSFWHLHNIVCSRYAHGDSCSIEVSDTRTIRGVSTAAAATAVGLDLLNRRTTTTTTTPLLSSLGTIARRALTIINSSMSSIGERPYKNRWFPLSIVRPSVHFIWRERSPCTFSVPARAETVKVNSPKLTARKSAYSS